MGTNEPGSMDRRSFEHSTFARRWKDALRSLYKEYQKVMLSVYGPRLQFKACHSKACVQVLLDASSAANFTKEHRAFKEAVEGELSGDGNPR